MTRPEKAVARAILRQRAAEHPPFFRAVVEDARASAAYRGERTDFRSRADAIVQVLRLMWVTDALLGLGLYRAKARLQALRVPIVPALAHRLAIASAQVSIGDPVIVHPGLYLPHGQVVIDGITEVHSGAVIFPFVTLGLTAGNVQGPTIGANAHIGTGAKIIGPVRIGVGARVGANAVVLHDVPEAATAVGVPARIVDA